MHGETRGHGALAVLHLAAALAHLRIEFVTQDGEEPSLQVGAGLETRLLVPGLDERFLDQIIGLVAVVRQRDRECSQTGDGPKQTGLELPRVAHSPPPAFLRWLSAVSS